MEWRMIRFRLLVVFLIATIPTEAQVKQNIRQFVSALDSIRVNLKVPGLATAIAQGDSVLFAGGFGFADMNQRINATANTNFRIASITKTFTSTLIMQLVEQGKLNLDSDISTYGLDFGNPRIKVRHLLTHTSEGEPGTHFQYNGYRYGMLGPIMETASGKPFYKMLMENIVRPLDMSSTAPGISLYNFFTYIRQQREMLPFFEATFTHLAKPYALNNKGEIVETHYLDEFGAFGGLASNVMDLLKYSAAIDKNRFVSMKTQRQIFTANRIANGKATPYGLGWFVQNLDGIDYYWHYGQTQGESGLFVKVPSKQLTLVVLTNTVNLSQPFPLGDGDIFMSPVGQLFYKYFINEDKAFSIVDYDLPILEIRNKLMADGKTRYKEFYNKELIAHATINNLNKDTVKARQLYKLYADMNFRSRNALPSRRIVAAIENAGVNREIAKSFVLTKPAQLRLYGVGENCSFDFSSWCDYGWIENADGKIIWQMQGHPAVHAGGALKNQKIEQVIDLPAGNYRLKYKSDYGHAYDNWDSLPPDNFLWGIIIFEEK